MSILQKLRQEEHKFNAYPDYIEKFFLKRGGRSVAEASGTVT